MEGPVVDMNAYADITGDFDGVWLQILEHLPFGVMITDIRGAVVYCNQHQIEIDELPYESIVGRYLEDLYSFNPKPILSVSVTSYCLNTCMPITNRWQTYINYNNTAVRALCHAYPLFRQGALSGSLTLTRSYNDTLFTANYANTNINFLNVPSEELTFAHLVGSSPLFLRAIELARASAVGSFPVLIFGETGVGKELFARCIHNTSDRATGPFVPINCAAIPENLFESMMFGTSKGAFTGADDKPGFFEEAEGGTIFFDELDSLPLTLQPKLLRVVQERQSRRLGSKSDKPVNVKIISASGRDPNEIKELGHIRSDLYFRLGTIQIPIPPLRERMEDMELLVNYFISKHSSNLHKKITQPSRSLIDLFMEYQWPGNIRELEHIIVGTMIMAGPRRQTLGPDLLPEHFKNVVFSGTVSKESDSRFEIGSNESKMASMIAETASAPTHLPSPKDITKINNMKTIEERAHSPASFKKQVKALEKELIEETLSKTYGNVALAAKIMGLSTPTLHYKLKRHSINWRHYKLT